MMRFWSRTLVWIASSWLLTACTESNAGHQPQAEPDDPVPAGHARIQLLETTEAEDYREHRWRIELDPALATWKWSLQSSGETPETILGVPLHSHEPFEVVYREQKVSGTQIVNDAERLGGEAAKQALLDAAPGIEEKSSYRCHVELRERGSVQKRELGSVAQGSSGLFRNWCKEGTAVPAGKQIVLTSVIMPQLEGASGFGHGSMAGIPILAINGKTTPIQELLEAGEYPGWFLWIQFDTAEDDASKDPK